LGFEVFTAVKIHVEFFRVVTKCSVVVECHRFRGPYCFRIQDEVYPTTTLHGVTYQKTTTWREIVCEISGRASANNFVLFTKLE
jgi:hypothetical protein